MMLWGIVTFINYFPNNFSKIQIMSLKYLDDAQNNSFRNISHSNINLIQQNGEMNCKKSFDEENRASSHQYYQQSSGSSGGNSSNYYQQSSGTNSNNSYDAIKSYIQYELRTYKDEIIRLKQRLNDFEVRQDHNDVKVDSIEIKLDSIKVKSDSSSRPAEEISSTTDSFPTFDPSLFQSYLSEKSGLWSNMITKTDFLKHQWVQQLR
jgi:hypothetical protein